MSEALKRGVLRRVTPLLLAWFATSALSAGSIGGIVFDDLNRSGEQDAGEAGLGGAPVSLMGLNGAIRDRQPTAADGSFLFSDLPDGDYLLSLPASGSFRTSLPNDVALPAPIPNFPFGSSRYSAPANLIDNLELADVLGLSLRHVGLGDSIGFGFNLCGSILGDNGYFEPTTARVQRASPVNIVQDKQSVPGDETADLLDPDIDLLLFANDVYYAVDEESGIVSISIGGNDFLGPNERGDAEIAAALVQARRNIQEILSSLVRELPHSDIEINTVYDNLMGDEPVHNTWVPIWMQVVREHAWAQERRVTIAETYPEYAHDEGGQVLGEPDLICMFFGLDEIHPTNEGYEVHEEKLWQAFGGVTLAGGSDRLDITLGVVAERGEARPADTLVVSGSVTDAPLALIVDGSGALVSSDAAELRVSDFLPFTPPADVELSHAVVRVTYRTTGAPIDDYYAFEASIDGTFSEPGETPTTWNTILPIVGSSGNDGAQRLAFADQPNFQTVAAPLYAGAPTDNGTSTLTFDDLESLSVRLVTTTVGSADPFAVEWDGVTVEVYVRPAGSSRAEPEPIVLAAHPSGSPNGVATTRPARIEGVDAAGREAILDALGRREEFEAWQRRVALAEERDPRALEGVAELSPRLRIEILQHFDQREALEALYLLAQDDAAPRSVRTRAARELALRADASADLLTRLSRSDLDRVARLAVSGLATLERD